MFNICPRPLPIFNLCRSGIYLKQCRLYLFFTECFFFTSHTHTNAHTQVRFHVVTFDIPLLVLGGGFFMCHEKHCEKVSKCINALHLGKPSKTNSAVFF